VGRCGGDMVRLRRWNGSDDKCSCGALQTRDYFTNSEQNPAKVGQTLLHQQGLTDLVDATLKGIAVARHWSRRI